MKKMRYFLLLLACMVLLSTTASADSLPFKPSLRIMVVNAPEGTLYLDLLVEDEGMSYPNDEQYSLDQTVITQLKTLEQDNWRLVLTTGSSGPPTFGSQAPGNNGTWYFFYHIPFSFRVAAATADKAQATQQTYTFDYLAAGAIVYDWAANEVVTIENRPFYFVVQFLLALLATLLIEGATLHLFGFREKRTWRVFLIVNVLTQLFLHLLFSSRAAASFSSGSPFPMLLPELVIFVAEIFTFSHFMEESTGKRRRRCALVANLVSYLTSVVLLRLLSPLLSLLV